MIIGLTGKKQTGKNTCGKLFQYNLTRLPLSWTYDKFINSNDKLREVISGYELKMFAYHIKLFLSNVLNIPIEDFEKEEVKNKPLPEIWNHNGEVMTIRKLLQRVGTDAIKKHVHPYFWINATFNNWTPDKNLIITDVRFYDEALSIIERKGIIFRVVRDTNIVDEHESEVDLDSYPFPIIDNNGNIEHTIEQIKDLLSKYRL